MELGNSREPVARRLKFKDAKVTAIHKNIRNTLKKALKMLFQWKKRGAFKANYRVLHARCLVS